jgi:hypothetical protein
MHYSEIGTIRAIFGLATFAGTFAGRSHRISRVLQRRPAETVAMKPTFAAVSTKVSWAIPDLSAGRAEKLTYVC